MPCTVLFLENCCPWFYRGKHTEKFIYLQGRTQTTQIGSHISERLDSTCGVPQGSVLQAHCFFLLYINDIQESSDKLNFYLFADDTNILFADKNLKSLELYINQELNKVYDWLTANKLTLNIKKSNFIIFCPAQGNCLINLKL